MRPTHRQASFIAHRAFTDREEARGRFQNAMADAQASDEYRILNWYGVGGQGKSALAREFVRLIQSDPSLSSARTAHAKIDLDDAAMRRPEAALISIRLQLATTFGHSFPAFDTAFTRLLMLTHPGVKVREQYPELFRGGENELLNDLLGISPDDLGTAVSDVVADIPGVGLLYKYAMRASARFRDWYARRGRYVLTGLDMLSADEIAGRLPAYLGADLCDRLNDRPKPRIVVILDTFEALWRDHNAKDPVEAHRADDWIRRLVQDAPGVLFVVLGRDRLRWAEVDPRWGTLVESHLLGNLADADADRFLRAVPIDDPAIRAPIIAGAAGLPFYLDLQVDQFEDAMAAGRAPVPEDFGGAHPRILARFLDHLGPDLRNVIRLASYPAKLDRRLMNMLAENFLGGWAHLDWAAIVRFSFIEPVGREPAGEPMFAMHALMRQYLQQRERDDRPELFIAIHTALFEHVAPQDQDNPRFSRTEEAAFETAIDHALDAGLNWEQHFRTLIAKFRGARRFRPLAAAYGKAIEAAPRLTVEPHKVLAWRRNLAEQIGNQGRYAEAEREFRAIWEIWRRPDMLGEEHPDTLTTRYSLAVQIGHQGRYAEAEREFRAIWAIQRRPDVLGEEHLHTLVTRYGLAQQIGNQGRYAEAERDFRAIWDIERRPDRLGEEHPSTLTTRHNLAQQIGNQGHYAEAEREFRAIWEIQRRPDRLGEEHPSTLTTRHNLAQQIGNQGRYAEAEREFRAIWEIERRPDRLGEAHPDTLAARHNLACQIGNQGRYAEAEGELCALWEILRRPEVLGEEHPCTLMTRHNLAGLIGNQGRCAEAEGEFRAILAIRRRPELLGEAHPDTLATRHSLAQQIGRQGRYAEAEREFRAIWEIRRRPDIRGEEHPETLRSRFWVARMLDAQGRRGDADAFLAGLLEGMRHHLKEGHPWIRELVDYLSQRHGPA